MKLTVSKIDKVLWSGEAESVTVPGAAGVMTVLSHHMPLITTLAAGEILVRSKDGNEETFPITSGFVEVGKTETTILI
jgi:F-type H+-transporting ATPase subunit epsilon